MNLPHGWTEQAPGADAVVFQVHKRFDNRVDVVVCVVAPTTDRFEVRARAEHPCSGPNETSHGVFPTRAQAMEKLAAELEDWDREAT